VIWALFAVYQAIHTLIGAAVDATGIPPDTISFPQALTAVTDRARAARRIGRPRGLAVRRTSPLRPGGTPATLSRCWR